MPIYEYACKSCDHSFEQVRKIAERNEPCLERCPECGKLDVSQKIGAVTLGDAHRMGVTKPAAGFNEVLRNISAVSPGNSMNIRD